MNPSLLRILAPAAFAWMLALPLRAQEAPAPSRPPSAEAEAQKAPPPIAASDAAVAAPADPEAPRPPAAIASPVASEASPAVEQATPSGEPGQLRRLDQLSAGTTERTRTHRRRDEVPFGDHYLAEDEITGEIVSILGSTTVAGEAAGEAVSVLGSTTVTGTGLVRREAVSVLGSTTVNGHVGNEVVSILGNTRVNGRVDGEVVSVLGNVELGPKAVVNGDVVVVGGVLKRDPGAIVRGNVKQVPFGPYASNFDGLKAYFKKCVLLGRPLAFGDHLGWAWVVALSFFALYAIFALLFPRGIERCARTLETRPGTSILWAVLTVLLAPIVTVLLCVTVVGALVVPFFLMGLFIAALFGKASMLAWIGRRFTKSAEAGPLAHPVVAVLIGGVILLALYVVPVLGLLTFKLFSWLGLGVAVYTVLQSMKREKAALAPSGSSGGIGGEGTSGPMPPPPSASVAPVPVAVTSAPTDISNRLPADIVTLGAMAGEPTPPLPSSVTPETPVAAPAAPFPVAAAKPIISTATSERAGFFIRLAAMLLDFVLIAVVAMFATNLVPNRWLWHIEPPGLLVILAIYAAVLWKLKGTTVGGVVCGLKVVRTDGREIDWATAIVRGLGCFLSLIVAGLGFIWVAIDPEKQSWHDKIAGTTVVRAPRGTSLV